MTITRRDFLASSLRSSAALGLAVAGGCNAAALLMPRSAAAGQAFPVTYGPFKGVYDSTDPTAARRALASKAVNMYVPDPATGSPMLARPGLYGRTTQYGTAAARDVSYALSVLRAAQCIYHHVAVDGSLYEFVFSGGGFYWWAGDTTDLNALSTAGVTVDLTSRIFCKSYQGLLIVSDGVNRPWVYDPKAGTRTLIQINAANDPWCAEGAPVVYGGKIIFKIKTIGATSFLDAITWCEENQPTVGYKQTGFNNYWELIQTGTNNIRALVADEGGLAYFRSEGIGLIVGTVDANFQANATRDSISATIGLASPAAIVQVDKWVWFLDQDGRPHRTRIGSGAAPEPMWLPMRRLIDGKAIAGGWSGTRTILASTASAAYVESHDIVLFTIWDRQTAYAFNQTTGAYLGYWTFCGDIPADDASGANIDVWPPAGKHLMIDAMGNLTDSNGKVRFCVAGVYWDGAAAHDGTFWYMKRNESFIYRDEFAGSLTATLSPHRIELPWLTFGAGAEARVLDANVRVPAGGAGSPSHTTEFAYATPKSGPPASFIALTAPGAAGADSDRDAVSVARSGRLSPNAQGAAIKLVLQSLGANDPTVEDPDPSYQWGVYDVELDCIATKGRVQLVYP